MSDLVAPIIGAVGWICESKIEMWSYNDKFAIYVFYQYYLRGFSQVYVTEFAFRSELCPSLNWLQQYIILHLNAHCSDDTQWLPGELLAGNI